MTTQTPQLLHHPKGITLPLTTEFNQIAQTFARQCPLSEKATQIRQNTLAVCAVNAYLQLLDIETNVGDSDSWNPMMQMMSNVADLKVSDVGTLSCRALLPQDNTCYVPPEDWHDRAGYVAVVVDEPKKQATLLGFVPTVDEEQVALERFGPMEALIDHVHSLQVSNLEASNLEAKVDAALQENVTQNVTQNVAQNVTQNVTQLGQWMQGTVAATWQALDALINPDELSFAFRSAFRSGRAATSTTNISRAQMIDLGIQLGTSLQVALIIHLGQAPDSQALENLENSENSVSSDRSEITIQVHPLGDTAYLAAGISLAVLDENQNVFRRAVSREIDNYIQIQIAGESGETFGVQISLGDATFVERFVI